MRQRYRECHVDLCVLRPLNPRRACAARDKEYNRSVCLSVRASSRTTGYEAANE